MDLSRLSISQITTNNLGFEEAVNNYAAHNIENIGIWTHKIEGVGPAQIRRTLKDAGIKAANLCFAGLFTGDSQDRRDAAVDMTKKALELTAEIEAGFLLVVSGPALPQRLEQSRDHVKRALARLVPFAEGIGAKMALEAIHPIDISRWSVVVTVRQALSIVRDFSSPGLGVLIDLYNSWWEPDIENLIGQAGKDLLGVHLADWAAETLGVDRRMLPGKGVIPLQRLMGSAEASGYGGCYDVEIFNENIWSADSDEVLNDIVGWFSKMEVG